MDEEKRTSMARRVFIRVAWVLTPAVIISAAYIIYMFHWTTHYMNIESEYCGLQDEYAILENAFRNSLEENRRIVEAAGYAAEYDETEVVADLPGLVREDLSRLNGELSPPLPEKDLTLRKLALVLLERKKASDLRLKEALANAKNMEERRIEEDKDKDLQALIYVQQIDRLKKLITELEGR